MQLLENKIAILSDLSDRTDTQVKQLITLMDQKGRLIQDKIQQVNDHIRKVDEIIEKSVQASSIFDSNNPEKEFSERKDTNNYIQAARFANQGQTAEEISKKIDLPISELEFIVKVNKDKLMFDNSQVPPWVESADNYEVKNTHVQKDMSGVFHAPSVNTESNQKLVDDLKQAMVDAKIEWDKQNSLPDINIDGMLVKAEAAISQTVNMVKEDSKKIASKVGDALKVSFEVTNQKIKTVRPFEFKKIETTQRVKKL